MNRTRGYGILIIGFLCVVGLMGCDQRPAVPTIAPEPTQPVVVIVVTATSQPTIAPTSTTEATITPIPTLTPIVTPSGPITVTATPVVQATRPPATAAAVQPTAEQPTGEQPTVAPPIAVAPSSFPAPVLVAPQGKDFREVDTIKYEFTSVGPLAADQCYRLDMTLGNPDGPGGVGDWWAVLCGDQSAAGTPLFFDLKPARFRDEPNYGSLILSADDPANMPPTPRYVMQVFMSVVRIVDGTDPIHPTVEALSPNSVALQNEFFK